MAKTKPVEISVATVFSGNQDKQQAFIELILHKRKVDSDSSSFRIDASKTETYNQSEVFSDVRVG